MRILKFLLTGSPFYAFIDRMEEKARLESERREAQFAQSYQEVFERNQVKRESDWSKPICVSGICAPVSGYIVPMLSSAVEKKPIRKKPIKRFSNTHKKKPAKKPARKVIKTQRKKVIRKIENRYGFVTGNMTYPHQGLNNGVTGSWGCVSG